MKTLGLILARGGSKRLPRKNVRPLLGIPLILWSIFAAKEAETLRRVVVSSDDDEILNIARKCKADVIHRPKELASDEVSSYPAIIHALNECPGYDAVCLLQPTSPFRKHGDIDICVGSVAECGLAAVVSAETGKTVPNGSIYVARQDWLRESLCIGNTHPFDTDVPGFFYMPPERSIDIDTLEDFEAAEKMADKF